MLVLLILSAVTSAVEPASSATTAVRDLIARVTPTIVEAFVLETIASDDGRDVFEIEAMPHGIVLRGNNGVSLASAYNRYLQQYCKCLYSLWGDNLRLPTLLPRPVTKVRVVTPRKIRHFFNYCTFNYSGTWWRWADWERIIDFLAMNGVNMPLQIVGTEAAWYQTLRDVGLADDEARLCLAAPVYLNWQWMGNLEGTGGPLPRGWIDRHAVLGRQIMDREIALGMTPILHGFSGVVPRALKDRFPQARIDLKPQWGRGAFLGTAALDPTDGLFAQIERQYLSNLVTVLGTAHHYMIDPFHESSPPVAGPEYLRSVARAIDQTLLAVDP